MTITGLSYEENEPSNALETAVVGMLNDLSPQEERPLNARDFVAIHRNGKSNKKGTNGISRPPPVTVKFLRYSDKDRFFTKTATQRRKSMFPTVGMHHNMCPRLIDVQKQINDHSEVKFVQFHGCNRMFSTCLHSGQFINYIKSYDHFITELENLE